MKRIGLIVLTLVAASALSGAMASTSQAVGCVRVAVAGTGEWTNSICNENVTGQGKEWIRIINLTVHEINTPFWCAKTEPNKGQFQLENCTGGTAPLNYVRTYGYQFWQRRGETVGQGLVIPLKLQLKGTATLSAPELNKLTIECTSSASEGSDIEGQGKARSGQDKGALTFKGCKTNIKECKVAEPITTNPTKSRLALSETTAQGKAIRDVDVFEPTEGTTFVELKLSGTGCGVIAGGQKIKGSVAAEIGPENAEVKEGLLSFPATAIKEVYNEQGKEKVGLTIGASSVPTAFSAVYGSQLESGEAFGVGG
jgi:hypothetical protein